MGRGVGSLQTWWHDAVHDAGVKGTVVRAALSPLAWLYGTGVLAYRWIYDAGLRPRLDPALPTVSVGSLAVGGAGKTTVAAYLARQLGEAGCKAAVVLRGYGRHADGDVLVVSAGSGRLVDVEKAGDEAAMLAEMLPGAVVVVGRRREAAIEAAAAHGAQVAVLDDGFEYFRLRRRMDILLVNLLEFGPAMRVLPAGVLRGPARLLSRAGQVWFTYAEAAGENTVEAALEWKKRWAPDAPVVGVQHQIARLRQIGGRPLDSEPSAAVLAFCGIGSPEGFRAALEARGLKVKRMEVFPDHHWYDDRDVERLATAAEKAGAQAAVTTWKDAIRLGEACWPADGPPLLRAEVELKVLWGAEHIQGVVELCQPTT